MITFSNPTTCLEIADYPLGGSKRGKCVFSIEYKRKKGFRFVRVTTDPVSGRESKPKTGTYSGQGAIVSGSDGRTYLIQMAFPYRASLHTGEWIMVIKSKYDGRYDFIKVYQHDLMSASGLPFDHAVFPENLPEIHKTLLALIEEANNDHGPWE